MIAAFEQMPGIGPKTAQRLTFHLLRSGKQKAQFLSMASAGLFENLKYCSICSNFAEASECNICSNSQRDQTKICVVGEPLDVVAIEKSGQYRGLYHVLHGVLSPLEDVGPENLTIGKLLQRLKANENIIQEVVFATNPTLEGEATAMYIGKLLKPFKRLKITMIARGLPVGGDLEYADILTLINAFQGRKEFELS